MLTCYIYLSHLLNSNLGSPVNLSHPLLLEVIAQAQFKLISQTCKTRREEENWEKKTQVEKKE